MYSKSAQIYDALYHFKDYAAASRELHARIQKFNPNARTLLDVGCGTAKHFEELGAHYELAGVDLSADMLEVARRRCPNVPFHQSDMTELHLGRQFDVVTCLFSAIAYVRELDSMRKAIARMSAHLKPGGMLFIEPWISLDRYRTGAVVANFVEQPDLKIAWMYVHGLRERVSVFDINYLVASKEGVEHFVERHEMGMFTHEEYTSAIESAGLTGSYDTQGLFGRGLYIGVKHA